MATYREIQEDVRSVAGFVPKTCWIAHVLADNGKPMRAAPNRIDPQARTNPCPPHRRGDIEASLHRLGVIP